MFDRSKAHTIWINISSVCHVYDFVSAWIWIQIKTLEITFTFTLYRICRRTRERSHTIFIIYARARAVHWKFINVCFNVVFCASRCGNRHVYVSAFPQPFRRFCSHSLKNFSGWFSLFIRIAQKKYLFDLCLSLFRSRTRLLESRDAACTNGN